MLLDGFLRLAQAMKEVRNVFFTETLPGLRPLALGQATSPCGHVPVLNYCTVVNHPWHVVCLFAIIGFTYIDVDILGRDGLTKTSPWFLPPIHPQIQLL